MPLTRPRPLARVPAPRGAADTTPDSGGPAQTSEAGPPVNRRHPADPRLRYVLHILCSAVLALGASTAGTPHLSPDAGPLTLVVASRFGGAGGAVLAGACAAVCLLSLAERLTRLGLRRLVAAPLTIALAPAFLPGALHDLSGFCALALVVASLEGCLRFVLDGETHGGFVAGLLLATAFVVDPRSAAGGLAVVLIGPALARWRRPADHGVGRATATVLAFPLIATVASWFFVEWRMAGDVAWIRNAAAVPRPGLLSTGALAVAAALMVTGLPGRAGRPRGAVRETGAPSGGTPSG